MVQHGPSGRRGRLAVRALGFFVVLCVVGVGSAAVPSPESPQPAGLTVAGQELNGSGTQADPYVVTTVAELQSINDDLDAHYVLGEDIDAAGSDELNNGRGFTPIARGTTGFEGHLDGQNHTIRNLTVERPRTSNVGLFAILDEEAVVENLALTNVSLTGYGPVGAVAGSSEGTVQSVLVRGELEATQTVAGGVVGAVSKEPVIRRAAANVRVVGDQAGGLLGTGVRGSTVISAYARGAVEGDTHAGGLIEDGADVVRNTYSTGSVSATNREGALIGQSLNGAQISASYWNEQDAGVDDAMGFKQSTGEGGTELRRGQMRGANATEHMARLLEDGGFVPTDSYPVLGAHVSEMSVTVQSSPIAPGESVPVVVTLRLIDGSTVTATAPSQIAVDSDAVSLSDGRIRARSRGEAEITARIAGFEDTTSVSVRRAGEIRLREASLTTEGVLAGTNATIRLDLENVGEISETRSVAVRVGAQEVATPRVGLAGDTRQTRNVSFRAPAPGEYPVTVGETALGNVTVVPANSVTLDRVEAPSVVPTAGAYDLRLTVSNQNDVGVSVPVVFTVDGETFERSVTVGPDTTTVAFTRQTDGAVGDRVTHTVTLQGTTQSVESEVRALPQFDITEVVAPGSATVSQPFSVTVTVANSGGADGSTTVEISVAGETVSTEEVTLGSGESATLTAELTLDADGTLPYTVAVGDETATGSITVEEPDEQESPDETTGTPTATRTGTPGSTPTETPADDGEGPGFGLVAGLVGLALLAARRRRTDG